jgi:hypothetical protein
MLLLPVLECGGSIDALRSFLNLLNQNDFVLVVAWLLAALRSGGPYPLLAVSGEQGSAKTVLSKLLRALVDPNAAPVRALPREERELMIAANNGHLLAFDNLSGLPAWLSDALCRLASGGSFALCLVQLGLATEELNRRWCEANTGHPIADVQRQVRHPTVRWMGATLAGRVEVVFEAKFMLPWSFSEEAAAQKYMAQPPTLSTNRPRQSSRA